jgi:UDP-glucose 4-epimerase
MKILVTGAGGFVGRALVNHLSSRGHEITAWMHCPECATPLPAASVVVDLLDAPMTAAALRLDCYDAVVHAAAITPASSSGALQSEAHDRNLNLTSNLLHGFNYRPEHFVYLSTLDVYAPPTGDSVLDETAALGPVSRYAQSKLQAEQLCHEWGQRFGMRCTIARLTQVFGPGDPTQKFIPSVIRKLKAGLPVGLHGDGSDLRDFLFVDDAAALLTALIESTTARGVYNLSSGTSRSLNDVLEVLADITGEELVIQHRPREKALVNYRFNVAKLRAAASFDALTTFRAGLERTLGGWPIKACQPASQGDLNTYSA